MKSQKMKISTEQRLPGAQQSKPAMVEQGKGPGAIALLKADHREVEALLEEYEGASDADVEHESIKQLVAEVEDSTPDDEHFDARVKVIGEYVKHHVKEEENELFPKLRDRDLDRRALGTQMAERKAELMAELEQQA